MRRGPLVFAGLVRTYTETVNTNLTGSRNGRPATSFLKSFSSNTCLQIYRCTISTNTPVTAYFRLRLPHTCGRLLGTIGLNFWFAHHPPSRHHDSDHYFSTCKGSQAVWDPDSEARDALAFVLNECCANVMFFVDLSNAPPQLRPVTVCGTPF